MEQPSKNQKGLLGRYALDGSETAFSGLVEQYIKLVYSTCYRELHQKELAEEATQMVFLELARKAATIRAETALASWLYKTAHFKATAIRRQEHRRMASEQHAFMETNGYERSEGEAWKSIEPALNDAIAALPAADREAILLRFFEELSLREVGLAMGASEEAAKKRVARALEKLRGLLMNRKAAAISTVALTALLTKHATYAVPAQLSASVCQSAGAIASSSLAPPVSGGVALQGRGGFPALNPLIGKGLLIVSTTKIVAGGAAAVLLILALTFVAVHKLHSMPTTAVVIQTPAFPGVPSQGVIDQAPPAGPGLLPSFVVWNAPTASDPATQQAEEQIKADFVQFAKGFLANDSRQMFSLISPNARFFGMNLTQQQIDKAEKAAASSGAHYAVLQFTVNSCSIVGNTADVRVQGDWWSESDPKALQKDEQRNMNERMRFKLVNTGGRWLITNAI